MRNHRWAGVNVMKDKYVFGRVFSLLGRILWAGCVDFMELSHMLQWLCVLRSGEGCRVEINVTFKELAVYIWGEMWKVGEAPALGNWTGFSGCVCTSRSGSCGRTKVEFWGKLHLALNSLYWDFKGVDGKKGKVPVSKKPGSWKVAWPGLESRATWAWS